MAFGTPACRVRNGANMIIRQVIRKGQMNMHDVGLLWVDVETTAIAPCEGELLEVGMCVTDSLGNPAKGDVTSWVIPHTSLNVNETTLGAIAGMHSTNGLLDACISDKPGGETASIIRGEVIEMNQYLDAASAMFDELRVAGRNPQFDVSWITEKLPEVQLGSHTSHRRLDMSTVSLMSELLELGVERLETDHRVATCLTNDMSDYRTVMDRLRKRVA